MWIKWINLSILLLSLSFTIKAANTAIVVRDKAVVFADPELKSPIGYLRVGVRVLVTEKNYSKDTVKGMAYKGKVVYVSLSDIDVIGEGSISDRYHFERFTEQAESD